MNPMDETATTWDPPAGAWQQDVLPVAADPYYEDPYNPDPYAKM
jgi:hypothetical protein